MKPIKPVFMKTYGKQRRKVSAWLSPENRKQAFDTTFSTDDDISVFEPLKPRRLREKKSSVASRRVVRPAKKKAMLCLTERSFSEDNIPSSPCPQPAQHSKTTREKRTLRSSNRGFLPAKRKTVFSLTETSSDEENNNKPILPPPQPTKQRRVTSRKSRLVSMQEAVIKEEDQKAPRTHESEEDLMSTAKCLKDSVQLMKDSKIHPPSTGRFVTRRRRAVTSKLKIPKATVSILSSSDDFTPGAFGSSKILRPSRRRRRAPQAFVVSSVENSVNAAGTASFSTNPLQEISLSELMDHSLRLCPRKPIFCSTPSAGPINKRPRLKPLSVTDQSSTPQSVSVSHIGVLSTFQEGQDSPGQPFSPPPTEPHSGEKPNSSLVEQEHSSDLFVESGSANKKSSCGEEAKSQNKMMKTESIEELSSVNQLTAGDSESSSHFVSAAGGLEWLIEALKRKCLTEHCTVQLERLSNFSVTQLCSQTTYSSCLGLSSSVHSQQTKEYPLSVDSVQSMGLSQSSEPLFSLHLSVTNNETSDLQLANGFESPEYAASVTDSQSINYSPSVDCKYSAEYSSSKEPMELSASALHVESTHSTNSGSELIMSKQLPASSQVQALFTDPKNGALKDECLSKKCIVQLKKGTLPQLAVRQLKGFTQQKEAMMASVRQPRSNIPVAQSQYNDPEIEEKAEMLTTMLKEKCLTDKHIVKIKRITLSQLKEVLQRGDSKNKSPTDVSDSASDDQTKNHHQSESDADHCNEDTSAMKVNVKKRRSTSSEENIASDKEEVAKNSRIVPHKRKMTSLAPAEKKSRSMDRSGTTRKACVSGLSVSRWKNKDSASTQVFRSRMAQAGGNKTVDCSISELISTQHKQPKELLGTTMNFSTPARANRLDLSSLLADLTPNTHTWSRLKAALSIHRKAMVLLTPNGQQSALNSPRRGAELGDLSQDLFATPFRTPLPKRLQSQLQSYNSLVEFDDADLSDAEKVYAECGQQRPLPWDECILPKRMKQCVKIGEGTFGEVFSTTNNAGDTVALKIIPVEGSEKVNDEDQKTFGEILHEIIISKELSSLKEKQQNQTHGFIGLKDLHCVQGCYPPDFLDAWDTFDEQKGSENDRPDFFEKDQLFIILEFEFGGIDLENCNGTLTSLGVAKSILHQVTAALAVAEQELCFEHRDLHWGNVLVKTTKQKKGSFLLNGATHSLETKGVLVRIIDYSLSRLEIDDLTVSCDISKDEELFMGQGDYQFEIYRLMRQENGNNWSNYHPHTNVLWLHYLCSKLLSMKYRGSGGRGAKDTREELTRFYDNILQYSSATEALQNCPMFQ